MSDLSLLRIRVSGGAALPLDVLRAYETRYGCPIIEGYGLGGTSPLSASNRGGPGRRQGSIGGPVHGVEIRASATTAGLPCGEIGEIIECGGPDLDEGLLEQPAGDRRGDPRRLAAHRRPGPLDADGFFFLVDRRRDVILRAGYTVYPREVEEVLYEHPAVRQAAVVGFPHPEVGEEIGAVVVLRAPASEDELRRWVRERVTACGFTRGGSGSCTSCRPAPPARFSSASSAARSSRRAGRRTAGRRAGLRTAGRRAGRPAPSPRSATGGFYDRAPRHAGAADLPVSR